MFHRKEGSLYCENLPLSALAAEYGTPLYVYSQAALDSALARWHSAFAGINPLICYAVKANGNLSILRHFAAAGCGFDIVSGGELARVLAAGGDAAKTVFSGVGKSAEEIRYALQAGIYCFNAESLPELERINEISGSLNMRAPVSLRINPDVDAKTHPYISTGLKSNKFGIAYAQAREAYLRAAEMPHLEIIGADCHIGSQLIDLSPLSDACARMVALLGDLAKDGITLKHLDLGGGVGIRYQNEDEPDLAGYAAEIARMTAGLNLKILLEPGRSLAGNAGVLLTRVEYVKHGEEKNFVVVDAAMNDLMRPALYQAYHAIEPAEDKDFAETTADVVGPVCETGDFLGKERCLKTAAGEILVIRSAGAYGMAMAGNYNSRPRAAEVLVCDDTARLIRAREKTEDLWRGEILPQ